MSGAEGWLSDFFELSTDRQVVSTQAGIFYQPIPAASIDRRTENWPQGRASAFRKVMRAMDQEFLAVLNNASSTDTVGNEKKKKVSARTMTPELFDAVFG